MGKDLIKFKGINRLLIILSFLTIIQVTAIIIQAYMLSQAIVKLFNGKYSSDILYATIFFITAFVCRYIISTIKQKCSEQFADIASTEMKMKVLEKLFKLGPRFARKSGTGNIVTLIMEGTTQLRNYLEIVPLKMINLAIVSPVIVIYIFFVDKVSALILIVTFPIIIIFMILLGLAAKKKSNKQWKVYRILSNHFTDSLRGLETLKFLGLSRKHIKKIESVSERYREATMGTLKVAFLSSFALDLFTMLSIATVAVFLGLRLIDGVILLGPALTILILAPEYFLPVREVGADYHATLNGQEAGKAMQDILDEQEFKVQELAPISDWNHASEMNLKDISVKPEKDGQTILSNINLNIKGFQKIGIVGESGSGKSTLIDLIGGFLEPANGTIQISGEEVSHLQIEDWQKQLIYIPQSPYIFSKSLNDNISFYRPNATTEEIKSAAVQAGLTSLIEELPKGLEEKIGEGGRALSGGQSQRVALARAYLENRPILLLDEPTSHLDIETEFELKQTMLQLFSGKLVFLATHRLHWMKEMDQIIVMNDGNIIEVGTHEELLMKKGHYYRLIHS
ncbi:thiol reductant ABC exporter subunit CydD [Gottfriedia acidiceleris]|uniref:Thiol reductant ABC exporter subunit CydD n=1 Tax=Gottfriedia acidiceleris TaxID=371036 RepID=A0ABY4JNU2_9BACI|nr:thiol reductant ABC exporter subunit CydD [Gottfriedia acidiceleris]UPM53990.1 thiol reductant ABC exporter subunit CydD [Gottfriedia acidiceleris]